MAYKSVIVEQKDHVGSITLNRPDQLNTFNPPLARELDLAFKELESSQDVRVVIVKGAGKAFCAGIDVKDFSGKSTFEYRAWIELMENP